MTRTNTTEPIAPLQQTRYGKPASSSNRPLWVVAGVSIVVGIIVLAWMAWGELQPRATGSITQFQVLDDARVQATLEVTRPVGQEGVCTLEALGDGFAQVGLVDIALPAAEGAIEQVEVIVATSEPATVIEVRSCRLG